MTEPENGQKPAPEPEILIFGEEDPGTRSLFRPAKDLRLGRGSVRAGELADHVNAFVEGLRSVLERLPRSVGDFEIDEISVSAEVSAKGTVALLGTGGELAGSGGLTFTFRKVPEGGAGLMAATAAASDIGSDQPVANWTWPCTSLHRLLRRHWRSQRTGPPGGS